jgi:hypothetical protein
MTEDELDAQSQRISKLMVSYFAKPNSPNLMIYRSGDAHRAIKLLVDVDGVEIHCRLIEPGTFEEELTPYDVFFGRETFELAFDENSGTAEIVGKYIVRTSEIVDDLMGNADSLEIQTQFFRMVSVANSTMKDESSELSDEFSPPDISDHVSDPEFS